MNTNLPTQEALAENSTGHGSVTRGTVRKRAVELAVINGRPAHDASKSDWEQAKGELTRELVTGPNEAGL